MKKRSLMAIILVLLTGAPIRTPAMQSAPDVSWPEDKTMALSLSFDDARGSQVTEGAELLNRYGVKATFYVVPENVRQHPEGWKKMVAAGHEIGNHSLNHPCTGNFDWSRDSALEDYTLEMMREELTEANRQIEALLGGRPESFAYPCGETYVGRGTGTKSYVPVVADLFSSGRSWLDETANDPEFCDLAYLRGLEMDGKDFDEIRPVLERAGEKGQWVILAGHEMGDGGDQTTRLEMLEKLIRYARNPENGIWMAPVKEVTAWVREQRE